MKLWQSIRSDGLSLDDLIEYFNANSTSYPYVPTQTLGQTAEEIGSDFQGLSQAAYANNGVVFACMMVRQLLFQEARFQFRRLQSGRPGEYFGTGDLAPLEQPAPNQTTGDLLARAIQDVDLAGNWYGVRLAGGIRRLRPDYVKIVLGSKLDADHPSVAPDAEILGYVYDPPSGNRKTFFPEEVAHFAPYPDPTANFRGMSWLTPVIREISADGSATNHKLKFFENGATPNMVVKFEPSLNKQAVEDWIEAMEENLTGSDNAYRTLYLGGGADATLVGSTMRDITFKEVQGAGETRIAAAAGVPPVIVGLSEGLQAATYSNYSQARRRFADGTMRPLWRNFAGSISHLIRVPRVAELWYDDRDIPFLAEDLKDAAEVQSLNAAAIKSLTEAGYDPDTVVQAILAGDLSRLTHTGMFSVQLHPPGSDGSTPTPAPQAQASTRSKSISPRAEADLRGISERFAAAEADVRAWVADAVEGDAPALLKKALARYDDLAGEQVGEAIISAYSEAYDAANAKLYEQKAAPTDAVSGLADSLTSTVSDALDLAKKHARKAFADVNADNVNEMADLAVTGHVDEGKRNWPLGAWTDFQMSMLGRRASSRGIKDGSRGGYVEFSSHGTTHPACVDLEGQQFPAATAPEPPIHDGCNHYLIPVSG